MHRLLLTLGAAIFGGMMLSVSGQAASFDCSKAKAPDEKAVCSDPTLSSMDSEMGALWWTFRQFPFAMGMSGVRQDDAEAFLAARRKCLSDQSCLKQTYQSRIDRLQGQIKSALDALVQQAGGGPVSPVPLSTGTAGQAPDTTGGVFRHRHGVPDAVKTIVDGYSTQCGALGGKLLNPQSVRILTGDIDGDGRQDYLLNTDKLTCDGAATAFCANAGCQVDIALSSAGFDNPVSLQGGVPALIQQQDDVVVELQVSRTRCEGADRPDMCVATYRWQDGKLEPGFAVRAQASN